MNKRLAALPLALPPESLQPLVRLAEEAAEIVQAATKIARFGFFSRDPEHPEHPHNWEQLENEVADLLTTMREVRALASRGTR